MARFFSVSKQYSMNWPASSVWVFIAQLVEHCSANAEATGLNPVANFAIAYIAIQLRWSHIHSTWLPSISVAWLCLWSLES